MIWILLWFASCAVLFWQAATRTKAANDATNPRIEPDMIAALKKKAKHHELFWYLLLFDFIGVPLAIGIYLLAT